MKIYKRSLVLTLGLLSVFACDGGNNANSNEELILPLTLSGALDSMDALYSLNTSDSATPNANSSAAAAATGCTITASSTNVNPGDPITFTMTGNGADVERAGFIAGLPDAVGDLPATKTIIAPDTTTRYVLSVFTVNGVRTYNNNCETTITVTPKADTGAPLASCSLDLDKDTAVYGEFVTLNWSSTNSTSGFITPPRPVGAVTGAQLNAGSKTFRNYWGTTYTMRVWNADGKWAECAANLTLNPGDNAPPIANDSAHTTSSAAILNDTMQATDVENDALTFQLESTPSKGSVVITDATTGTFQYTPDAGASGDDSFTFSASDAGAQSNTGVVRIQITQASSSVTLDPTFGNGGITTTDFFGGLDASYGMAQQADGKYVLAGTVQQNSTYNFGIARYNNDGTLDSTFGNGGKVITSLGSNLDEGRDLIIQPDGKILMAGSSALNSDNRFALVRYNTDGSLDSSFGSNGLVLTNPGPGNDSITALALLADGKILAAGYTEESIGNGKCALLRYNPDGSLDSAFGNNGLVTTSIEGTSNDHAWEIALQSDGKIVLVGSSSLNNSSRIAVAQYNSNGTLDTSFDNDGKAVISFNADNAYGFAIALQPNGKILAGGYTRGLENGVYYVRFAIARFNTDGSPDGTFGTNGKVESDFGPNGSNIFSMRLQTDGKILAAGYSSQSYKTDFTMARYNTDGSLDLSFDGDGVVQTILSITPGADIATSMLLQPDGKIVLSGQSISTTNGVDFTIMRFNP